MRNTTPWMLALAGLLAIAGTDAAAQKLYRWTDKDGKVHYSDHVPPEAVEAQRDTLNQQGMTVDRVDRALTPEERAEQQRIAAEAAELAAQQEEQGKRDAILLASYQSEADLQKSYAERFDLLEKSLESARIGVVSQQKSLAALFAHAAELERAGKPISPAVTGPIELARTQVRQQREFLAKRDAEKVELQREFDQTLAHYRSLQTPSEG